MTNNNNNNNKMPEYILSFDPAPINMSYMLMDIHTLKIRSWGVFNIKDSTNAGSCKKLSVELDKLSDFIKESDNVIIVHEHQPRCNIKTITISGQLQMYYVLNNDKINKIVGHHAKYKTLYFKESGCDSSKLPEKLNKLKSGHYKNKQISIEQCKQLLIINSEDQKWIDFFNESKKKDDLSDSYIQALSYLKMNKIGYYSK